MKKACFKCGETKLLGEFYRHPQMKDGRLNKCKECTKRDVNTNRSEKLEKYIAYDRKRNKDPKRKEQISASTKRQKAADPEGFRRRVNAAARRYTARNRDKKKARSVVGRAIRDGKLQRQPCEICGANKVKAHHDDYTKPLDVRWLCIEHHNEHHVRERDKAAGL